MLTRFRTIIILNTLLVVVLILGLDGVISSLQTAFLEWKMETVEETELPGLLIEHRRLSHIVDSLTIGIDSLPKAEPSTIENLRSIAGSFKVTMYQLDREGRTDGAAGQPSSRLRFRGSITNLLGFLNRCEQRLEMNVRSLRLGRYSDDGRTLTLDIEMDLSQ